MKLRHWILFLFSIFLIWTLFSIWIDNSIILPSPFSVFRCMMDQARSIDLYLSLIVTLFRVLFSLFLSFIFGLFLAFIMVRFQSFYLYFEKILLFLRSIPNVTFVILLLFWVPREWSITIVAFLLLFPIFFQNLYEGILQINQKEQDLFRIYPQSFLKKFRFVYFPLLKGPISSSWISCSSLAYKVVVMAEVLTSISVGIGSKMQYAHLNVDLASVMAWTIWLLICVLLSNKLLRNVLHRIYQ